MTLVKDVLISLRGDSSGAEAAFTRAEARTVSLHSSIELLRAGFDGLKNVWGALDGALEKGQAFGELSQAFDKLYGSANALGKDGLGQLRTAVKGTIDDVTLLKEANYAAMAGLSADEFKKIAAAAEDLGDAIGRGPAESLDTLSRAVALGNERLAKQAGLVIDSKRAEEIYAASIGITVDRLNDEEKAQAHRQEMMRRISETASDLAGNTDTAKDATEKLSVAWSNAVTQFGAAINNATLLTKAIQGLGAALNYVADGSNHFSDNLRNIAASGLFEKLQKDSERLAKLQQQLSQETNQAEREQVQSVIEVYEKRIAKTREAFAKYPQYQQMIEQLVNAEGASVKANEDLAPAAVRVGKAHQDSAQYIKSMSDALNKEADDARKALEQLQKMADGRRDFYKQDAANRLDQIQSGLDQAVEQMDLASFQKLSDRLYQEVYAERIAELSKHTADGITQGQIEGLASADAAKALQDWQAKFGEGAQKAFEESVGFFADILTTSITGSSQDIEQILTDALKRVAIGFVSEIMAGLAMQLGFNVSGLGSAQGLGMSIGGMVLSSLGIAVPGAAGGAGGAMGSLGSVGATAAGAYLGMGAMSAGAPAAPVVLSAGGTMTAAGSATASGTAAGGAGSATLLSNPYFIAAAAVAAIGYITLDKLGVIESNFGGITNAETMDRHNTWHKLDKQLGNEFEVPMTRGTVSLNDYSYNISEGGPFAQRSADSLTAGMGYITAGEGGKLGQDFQSIFANATSDGVASFNEALINAQSLMEKLGLTAEQGKQQLSDMFLDGKLSMEEFGQGVQSFNVLATDNLIGTGSVKDAIEVMSKTIDKSPRTALKGLELAFKEMKELGIDETGEIHAYMMENFGPDMAAVFDELAKNGIDSFEDLKNLSADQLYQIFAILQQVKKESAEGVGADMSQAAQDTNNNVADMSRNYSELEGRMRQVGRAAEDATRAVIRLNEAASRTPQGSYDPNASVD